MRKILEGKESEVKNLRINENTWTKIAVFLMSKGGGYVLSAVEIVGIKGVGSGVGSIAAPQIVMVQGTGKTV